MSKITTFLDGMLSEIRGVRDTMEDLMDEIESYEPATKDPIVAVRPGTQVTHTDGSRYIVTAWQGEPGKVNCWYWDNGVFHAKPFLEENLKTADGHSVVAYQGKST